jgi:excisionase family DNA binding protein
MKSSAEVSLVILNDLISVKTAVAFSGYSLQYIRRLLRTGKLVGLKIGQLWLIDKTTFEAYLKNVCKTADRRYGPKNNNKS